MNLAVRSSRGARVLSIWLLCAVVCAIAAFSSHTRRTLADAGAVSWQVESRLPFLGALHDAAFSSTYSGTLVGDNGSIWVTRDSGLTWSYLSTHGADSLKHVVYADASHGYIAGDHSLLSTNDGGLTWSPLAPPSVLNQILAISAPADGSVFLLTTIPVQPDSPSAFGVFASYDRGATWRYLTKATGLSSMSFTDKAHGWLGTTAGVLRTQDGGATWTTTDLHESFYPAITFADQNTGWLVAQNFLTHAIDLFATTDGGASWQNLHFGQTSYYGFLPASIVAASQRNVSFVLDGTAYASTDGGTTLIQQALPSDAFARAVTAAGYRGSFPYLLAALFSNAYAFLTLGSPPAPTSTATNAATSTPIVSPTASNTVIPTSTPTVSGVVPVPTIAVQGPPSSSIVALPAASPVTTPLTGTTTVSSTAPLASIAALPAVHVTLGINTVEPSTAVAGDLTPLLIHGTGFDAQATVIIGGHAIYPTGPQDAGLLRLQVPSALQAGSYNVRVLLANGASTTLPGALTVLPKLQLGARLLPATVKSGAMSTVLVQTLTAATLAVHPTSVDGRPARDVVPLAIRGAGNQWTVQLRTAARAGSGTVLIRLDATYGAQHARRTLPMRIVGAQATP